MVDRPDDKGGGRELNFAFHCRQHVESPRFRLTPPSSPPGLSECVFVLRGCLLSSFLQMRFFAERERESIVAAKFKFFFWCAPKCARKTVLETRRGCKGIHLVCCCCLHIKKMYVYPTNIHFLVCAKSVREENILQCAVYV